MNSINESNILNSICEYLEYKRHFFWRSNNIPVFDSKRNVFRAMPKYSKKGTPDIIVVKDGFIICLEIKKPKNYQSKDQKQFEKEVKEAGAEYYVIRSITDVQNIGL